VWSNIQRLFPSKRFTFKAKKVNLAPRGPIFPNLKSKILEPDTGIGNNFEPNISNEKTDKTKDFEKRNTYSPRVGLNINKSFDFGLSIDIDPRIIMNHRTNVVLIDEIIQKHYYFDPKYYNFDFKNRILYSKDRLIELKLNFNFVNINKKYLYFILSVMELNLLGLIKESERNEVISIVAKYLELKISYKYKKRLNILRKFVNGREKERIVIILTSEEFSESTTSALIKLQLNQHARGYQFINNNKELGKLFQDSS
jgi:hypothetical protein